MTRKFNPADTKLKYWVKIENKCQVWPYVCVRHALVCVCSPWTPHASKFTVWGLTVWKLGSFQQLLTSVHAGTSLLDASPQRLFSNHLSWASPQLSLSTSRLCNRSQGRLKDVIITFVVVGNQAKALKFEVTVEGILSIVHHLSKPAGGSIEKKSSAKSQFSFFTIILWAHIVIFFLQLCQFRKLRDWKFHSKIAVGFSTFY